MNVKWRGSIGGTFTHIVVSMQGYSASLCGDLMLAGGPYTDETRPEPPTEKCDNCMRRLRRLVDA